MVKFIDTINYKYIYIKLSNAIIGKGAFRRFKDNRKSFRIKDKLNSKGLS